MEVAGRGETFVSLEELAEPYARHLVEHLGQTDRQGTAASSRFLDACRQFAEGNITKVQLITRAVKLSFANVLNAFHNVNQREIPVRFFIDERGTRSGICLTDELLTLGKTFQHENFDHEVEARWRLVETA